MLLITSRLSSTRLNSMAVEWKMFDTKHVKRQTDRQKSRQIKREKKVRKIEKQLQLQQTK